MSCSSDWGTAMGKDRLFGKKTLNVGGFLDEFEKDDIKRKVDIVRLFEHFGIRLKKKGKGYVGLCPWHNDKNPSLSVTRETGIYHCFSCHESGDHFTLVMKMKGYDFKGALTFLKGMAGKVDIPPARSVAKKKETPGGKATAETELKTGQKKKPPDSPVPEKWATPPNPEKKVPGPEMANISLDVVCDYYQKKLYENKQAMAYLTKTRKIDPALIRRFKIGFADGSLLKIISNGQKEALKSLGILKTTDKGRVWEFFTGCLTFPVVDEPGKVVHFYGRKADPAAEQAHLYLSGSHRSIFNRKASRVYDIIIIVESVIDCLSLITIGFENVQPLYGVGTLTDEHLQLLKDDRVKTIILALDNDAAGRAGTGKHEIEKLIEQAPLEQPPAEKSDFKVVKHGIKYIFTIGNITYRIVGVKEIFVSSLRVQIKAEYEGEPQWDGLDLYSSRSRTYYSNKLAEFYDIEAKIIEKHLIMILEYLEDERDRKLDELSGKKKAVEMTEEERKLGMDFLTSPDMFDQIVADMETLGYVGEDLNKQLLYIAASSRKMDDPISILIISSSSAGKSYLVDTVKRLMPEEDVLSVTSLSDQALNYIPDGGLVHKFLILGEAVHSDIIEHQIRDMLSDHRLARIVTVKDEKTGRMVAETLTTECIVALVMSTTRHDINPENASRCFLINADESPAQTKRIHSLQRNKYSLARYYEKKHTIPQIIRKHRAAQRLLRKILIVNPFGKYLDFPHQLIRTRRDHDRFMDLIAGVCFQRQCRKEIKTKVDKVTGEVVEYIECDLVDYEMAYNIMVNSVLSSTFAELPKSVVRLYEEVRELFHEAAKKANLKPLDVGLTQRDIREKIKWTSASTIREGLRKLVMFEYLVVAKGGSRGMRNSYSLVSDEPMERLDCSMIPTVEEIKKRMEKDEIF
jgi:DNA primase